MFYNSKRQHGPSEQMPAAEYEKLNYKRFRSMQIIRGDSGEINYDIEANVSGLIQAQQRVNKRLDPMDAKLSNQQGLLGGTKEL